MLKIVAAFDGLNFSLSTQQYAIDLAKKLDAFLKALMLTDQIGIKTLLRDFKLR